MELHYLFRDFLIRITNLLQPKMNDLGFSKPAQFGLEGRLGFLGLTRIRARDKG